MIYLYKMYWNINAVYFGACFGNFGLTTSLLLAEVFSRLRIFHPPRRTVDEWETDDQSISQQKWSSCHFRCFLLFFPSFHDSAGCCLDCRSYGVGEVCNWTDFLSSTTGIHWSADDPFAGCLLLCSNQITVVCGQKKYCRLDRWNKMKQDVSCKYRCCL